MIRLFNQYFPVRKICFFAAECAFISLAIVASLLFHKEFSTTATQPFYLLLEIGVIILIYNIALFFSDFYSFGLTWGYTKLAYRLIVSLIFAFCISATLYRFTANQFFSLKVLATIFIAAMSFLLPWRMFYSWFINQKKYKQNVLILGSDKLARNIARAIIDEQEHSLHVEGFISDNPSLLGVSIVNPSVIGSTEDLLGIVHRRNIRKIIVAMEERRGTIPLEMLLKCKSYGISVEEGVDFYERMTNKMLVEHINPSNLIYCDDFKISYQFRLIKRTSDILIALIGLVLSLPFFLIVPVLIRLESKGPIFFKQQRVGRDEVPFNIYKFRSMQDDAEKKTGPVMASEADNRITRIGKIIRKTRLDELPQLWNILKGDMSFVGPRPERPMFVQKFKKNIPFYSQRFMVRPGLTGWAQIRCAYASTIEETLEKLRYELYYIKNCSLLFDLTIILRTVKVILFAKGM